jgi:AraC family transcriptional regulator
MDWRTPDSDRLRSAVISPGQIHIGDGRLPFWVRCDAQPSFFAVSMAEGFVKQIWEQAFEAVGDFAVRSIIGSDEPVVAGLGLLARRELDESGTNGRLYAESLATALAVHLLRRYGTSTRIVHQYKGGLASWQLRRVLDYVNTHLDQDLSLVELSRIAELSPHHFGDAFKVSMGTSPHRYVIERRVCRARKLLRDHNLAISDIAFAVGFSSQSHFTANFRRVVGVTPRRFRRLSE